MIRSHTIDFHLASSLSLKKIKKIKQLAYTGGQEDTLGGDGSL